VRRLFDRLAQHGRNLVVVDLLLLDRRLPTGSSTRTTHRRRPAH